MELKPTSGSRLAASEGISLPERTSVADQASKLWDEQPLPAEKPARTGVSAVGIGDLYIFMWKLAIAGAIFAVPFVIVFLVLTGGKW